MKELILKSLKTKYSNLGFDENVLGSFAETIASGVTEEGQIEAAIAAQSATFTALQSFIDKRVTTAVDKAKGNPPAPSTPTPNPNPGDPVNIAEIIQKALEPMQNQLATFQNAEVNKVRGTKVNDVLSKIKNEAVRSMLSESFAVANFNDNDSFDAYLTNLSTKVESVVKDETAQALNTGLPAMTFDKTDGVSNMMKEMYPSKN